MLDENHYNYAQIMRALKQIDANAQWDYGISRTWRHNPRSKIRFLPYIDAWRSKRFKKRYMSTLINRGLAQYRERAGYHPAGFIYHYTLYSNCRCFSLTLMISRHNYTTDGITAYV